MAGRVSTADGLRALASGQAVIDAGPLCGSPGLFAAIKSRFVCPNADIGGNPALDFTGATCDSLSVSGSFLALPARFGAARAPDPTRCEDPADPKFASLYDCSK